MDSQELKASLDKCVEHLKAELAQIRTGRATTELLEPVKVDAYNTISPLKNLGNISVSDAKSLTVQVWDKGIIENVAKGINAANLGLSVSIEGDLVRVRVPDLTQERRKELVNVMKDRIETARVAVRNVRQKFMKEIEESVRGGMSEDEGERLEKSIETEIKTANETIEELRTSKEADLMEV